MRPAGSPEKRTLYTEDSRRNLSKDSGDMKRWLSIICCLACLLPMKTQYCQFPFQNRNLLVEKRVEDLLNRLTLDEKLSLMEHRNPPIERLGLKGYSWWNEALHGVGRNGYAHVYPMPIALAATWDTALVEQLFRNVAREALAKYVGFAEQALDTVQDYAGLTFFTPNINILRDPRWGRGMETYGEDPMLTALMGASCVEGLQSPRRQGGLMTAACLKHLAAHSGPEGIRHQFDAEADLYDLRTTYLPAFEYIVTHTDVQQVMCGYNRLNGEPCCTNKELLLDLLRNEWGYRNMVVTDCWALNDCWERDSLTPRHETHPTAALAAAAAFGSEVDLECGSGLDALRTAVDSGYVTEGQIDQHVRRILRTRFLVGIDNFETKNIERTVSSEDLDRTACEKSLVLLKNEGPILPLDPQMPVALAGPMMNDSLMPLGNYNGTPWYQVTLHQGLSAIGNISSTDKADIVIYAGGITPQWEGEELQVEMPGFLKGDRTRIELPENQIEDLRRLRSQGKKIVLVLSCGSALGLEDVQDLADAVVVAWYGGQMMGTGVADALYDRSFDLWGRLPVTFYKNTSQLPDFESYSMKGRTYRYMDEDPLYPFGFGLTYCDFHYWNVRYDKKRHSVKCMVTNHSDHDGHEVVQIYLRDPHGTLAPKKQLIGFQRVFVEAHSMTQVEVALDPFWLRRFDPETGRMEPIPAGEEILLMIGSSSADKDLTTIQTEL